MQFSSKKNSQLGFTLTEVLIAVAIFAIIFVAALLVYDRSNQIFQRSMEASDVQQNTRVAFDTLVADLRMAGFDYDRDGFPTGENKFQQPDEQLEFIHEHAITLRTNLDYETDAATDHGRETAYEPGFGTPADDTDDFFPIVTTANDEIVTYALVSDEGDNDDEITFYADVAKPRASYPGGSSETLVTITGVDLCDDGNGCANPPYTLYRFTLDDSGNIVKAPVADNVRSLDLEYYSDALATNVVTPNEGAGQYTVDSSSVTTSAAANAARGVRTSVQSIHMRLVGMSEYPDVNYESPQEQALASPVDSAVQHRQYVLESNVVPRNLGRRGMEEPATTPPGAPKVTSVCAEGCGVVRVDWSAPEYGSVDGYQIIYDTVVNGAYGSVPINVQKSLYGYVPGLDPTQTYYFKVVASNSYGSQRSLNSGGPIQPINYTKPVAPALTSATGDPDTNDPPAVVNDIVLTWDVSQLNETGAVNSCSQLAPVVGSLDEVKLNSGFQIYRSTVEDFDPDAPPADMKVVFDGWVGPTGAPVVTTDWKATWTDTTGKLGCTTYYYRVRQKERCAADAALNSPANITQSFSEYSNTIKGQSSAGAAPVAPVNVNITTTSTCLNGECDVNLLWDRVTEDMAGKPILVDEYIVKRVFAPGGIENSSTAQTFTVADPDPTATGQMTWLNQTSADPTLVQPADGDRYHYYVAARQCDSDSYLSVYSSPATKFPCAIVTSSYPSPAPLDGDGQTSPYLIYANSASMTLDSNKAIDQALMTIYVGNTNIVVVDSTTTPGIVSHVAPSTTATFNIPLDSQIYRAEMTMIDQTGCGTTVVRYFQESFTNCCLVPILEDPSVLVESGGVVKVTLKNQCFSDLTLNQFKLRWQSGNSAFRRLVSVTYKDGTVDNFGGVPKGISGGGTISSTATIAVPAGVSAVIPGSSGGSPGTYTLALTFENDGNAAIASNIDFCGIYADPDNPGTDATATQQKICGVVSAYTAASLITNGSITIGSQTFVIAAGTDIDNEALITIGADICLNATVNALVQITAPTSVTANFTCSVGQSAGICTF